MTPKEKALNLCQKFGMTTLFAEDCNNGYTLPLRMAKQCALIAVDEIINSNPHSNPFNTDIYSTMDYWQDVKEEINLL